MEVYCFMRSSDLPRHSLFLFFFFMPSFCFLTALSVALQSHDSSFTSDSHVPPKVFDKLVVSAWAFNVNSKLMTKDLDPNLAYLKGKNITDVISTERAFAVRVANDFGEADEAVKRLSGEIFHNARLHPTADGARSAAAWVIWGEYYEPEPDSSSPSDPSSFATNVDDVEIPSENPPEKNPDTNSESDTKDWGGKVPTNILKFLRSAAPWPTDIPEEGETVGHIIYANDICPMKDAFVAILGSKLVCWGANDSCKGWDKIIEERPSSKILKALCAVEGYATLPILDLPHTTYKSNVAIFGRSGKGGEFPTDDPVFMHDIASVGDATPLTFVGNSHAVALLLQGGKVIAWGDPKYGGSIPKKVSPIFIRSLYANGIGFAAIKVTNKVISWGDFPQQYIPVRITEEKETAKVTSIISSSECFVAMIEGGSIATWGRGDLLFCNENGAGASDNYVSFMSVKNSLESDIKAVVSNDLAFAAVKGPNNDVITWGNRNYGGSKVPLPEHKDIWNSADIKQAKPETLVSTCCAFAFIRSDGRGVSWGSVDWGGWWEPRMATKGILSLTASNETLAAIDRFQGVARWTGESNGYMEVASKYQDYNLNYEPKFLFRTTTGIMLVMGEDCSYTEWGPMSACSVSCGGGMRIRTREIKAPALNGRCEYHTQETEDCNMEACQTKPSSSSVSEIPTSTWIGIGMGTTAVLGVVAYGCMAFCKRKQSDSFM